MKQRAQRGVLVALALLLLCVPVLLCLFAFGLPPQYTETFLGELPHQVARLRAAESPRIILVGGSSVPFSVRSELVEEAFPGYTVVDFGLYADIGTPVMLDFLEEELRAGDTVLISPEQDEQTLSTYCSGEALWQAVDSAFDLLGQLSPERYETLAASLPAFAGKKCFYWLFGTPAPEGIYARASFNAYGDIDSPLREANILSGGFDPNQRISFSPEALSEDFLQTLNDFAHLAEAKGAEVYYRFPPMNRAALAESAEEQVDEYYDFLRSRLDFPILGDPHRSILESGWFYDTNFHLNTSGAVVFTKTLIEDLKLLWQDTSPTQIALPAMPEPAAPALLTGDDSCQDCFTYRREGAGWVVRGLTGKGQAAQVLVVPVSYENQPVTGLDAGVFVGDTALRELALQANIGMLYDGMFRGCTGLKRVLLTADSPAAYTVGDGLREGADFLLCVPENALEQYRRHYSWQQYSGYLSPMA